MIQRLWYILLLSGVMGFVILVVVFNETLPNAGFLLLAGLIALFFAALWPRTIAALRIYWGAPERRSRDVSAEGRLSPESITAFVAALDLLGFRRLGETAVDLPGLSDATTWYFTSPDETTVAEVAAVGYGLLDFSTVYADDSTVYTSFPVGENLDRPGFRSRRNAEGIGAAYTRHRQEAAAFQAEHGPPRRLGDMAALLAWGETFRQRYSRHLLRPPIITLLKIQLWFLYMLGFLIAVWLTMEPFDVEAPPEAIAAASTRTLQLLTLGLVIAVLMGIWAFWGQRQVFKWGRLSPSGKDTP